MIAVLPWLLVVEALAAAVLPLTMRVFRGFPDRGFGVGRVLAIVLVGVACWLTSLLGWTAYRPQTAVVAALAFGVVAWSLWGGQCRAVVRARWRLLGLMEALFLLPLLVGIVIRAYNADIVGQEKFMDMAFLHALLRATDLPAEDMWLAGYGLPYYYLSYLLAGLPAKIAGTHPPVAYNLAMAFVFAAGFAAAASIVYALLAAKPDEADRRALAFAVVGGLLVMVVGNLVGPLELLAAGWGDPGFWQAVGVKGLAANPSGGLLPADGGWWWRSSRVIPNIPPDGITEFPYFSFLLGDLHPHYVAIVLDLLIVALALDPWLGEERPLDWVRVGVAATALAAATLLGVWLLRRPLPVGAASADLASDPVAVETPARPATVAAPAVPSGALAEVGAALAAIPSGATAGRPVAVADDPRRSAAGEALVSGEATSPCDGAHPAVRVEAAEGPTRPSGEIGAAPGGLGLLGLTMLAFSALGEPTLALLVSILILLGWASWRFLAPGHGPVTALPARTLFVWLLAAYALLVLVGVELVFLRDLFGSRMNTVFKFHYHVWLLLGIATAATVGTLWGRGARPASPARSDIWRYLAGGLIALTLAGGLVYPLAATWTKSGEFRGQPTLDGERFLQRNSPADHRAIEWLRATVPGRPVIVEAVGGSYQEFARVSTFAGLPTILGWAGHEVQWRGERPDYARRERDVDAMYRAESREEILRIARQYGARYLFFGTLERNKYGAEAQARLDSLLPIAFNRGGTTIYHLSEGGSTEP